MSKDNFKEVRDEAIDAEVKDIPQENQEGNNVPEKEEVKKPGLLKRIFSNKKVRIGLGATAALVGVTIAGKVLKGIAAGHCGCPSGDQDDYEDPEEEKDDSEEDED